MNTKNIILALAGAAAVIAVAVVVNITIVNPMINPPPQETKESIIGIVSPAQAEKSERKRICDSLQKKIDKEGRPGWDALGKELQAEMTAARTFCTLQGNGKMF